MKNLILFPSVAATAMLLVSACVGEKRTATNTEAPAVENVAQVAVVEVPIEEFLKDSSDDVATR